MLAVSCSVRPISTLPVAGDTVTLATVIGATVIGTLARAPSLSATMTAAPVATARTSPVESTLATAGAPPIQVTARPVSAFPCASNSRVVSRCDSPASIVALAGVTWILATGTVATVTTAVPVFPSDVAVMRA